VEGRRKDGKGSMCCEEENDVSCGWAGGGGIVAETTEERGGRDRGCDSLYPPPPEVGGRLELDPGRPSRGWSERLKLYGEEKGRKDCD
jgi:hypothetical protein